MAAPYMETDPRFYSKLLEVSNNVGISPQDLLVVMALESGINSSIHNDNYGGLVQMSNNTLKGLDYNGDVKDFSQEPAFKQLDYIEKHILRLANILGKKFDSAEQYYIGNLLPVALKLEGVRNQNPDTIIVAKNPVKPHLQNVSVEKEKVFYNSNSGLDLDKDGAITYKDISNFLSKKRNERHYKHAILQLSNVSQKKDSGDTENNLLNELDNFLNNVLSSDKNTKTNNFTIFIMGEDLDTSIEFSRVLSLGLREQLNAKATSHIDGNKVEVSCKINGPEHMSKKIIQSFTKHLSECFYNQTTQIGGLIVNAKIKNNKKSEYNYIDYNTATRSYRRFMSKFLKG